MQSENVEATPVSPLGHGKTAVITRTKSRPLLLRRALESVLGQTDPDFIHVIVNDGGDATELNSLLQPFLHRYAGRLKVLNHAKSRGMEAASNQGLLASESRYIAIHDDDDAWHPEFLEKMTQQLDTAPGARRIGGVVCFATEILERMTESSVTQVSSRSLSHMVNDLSLWRILAGNCFPPISFLYKRSVYAEIGGLYREDLPVQGDWEFNVRFLQKYNIGMLGEHLARYHTRVVEEKRSPSAYANSLQGADRHEVYKTLIRNEYLRRDLERGQLGIGYLMNLNPMLLRSDRIASKAIGWWDRLTRLVRI